MNATIPRHSANVLLALSTILFFFTGGAAEKAAAQTEDMAKLGEKNFALCLICHLANGQGQPNLYPPLDGSEVTNGSIKRLIPIVLNGLNGPVSVKGTAFNGQMQAWGPIMSDKKIASILTYIRQAWGNKSGPVTPEDVAAARKLYGTRTTPWTIEEIQKLPE